MGIFKEALIETKQVTEQMLLSTSDKEKLLRMQLKCARWNVTQMIKLANLFDSIGPKTR